MADNKASWEEVKEHKSKSKGVWVVIHNKVYDVTQFMDDVSLWCLVASYNRQCAPVDFHPVASGWRGGPSRASRYSLDMVISVIHERCCD